MNDFDFLNFWSWIFVKTAKFWASFIQKCRQPPASSAHGLLRILPIGWYTFLWQIGQSAALFWFELRDVVILKNSSRAILIPQRNNCGLPHFWSRFGGKDCGLCQCCGSMTLWGGSGSSDPCLWLMDPDPGSGSCYFRYWPSRCQQKTNFLTQFFLLITFWSYIYTIFQRWKVKKSHKIVGIKVFLTIFALW